MKLEILLVIAACVVAANAAICTEHTCQSIVCAIPVCPPGFKEKKNGGFCGCCDNCVRILHEGESCNPNEPIGGLPNEHGLTNSDPECGSDLFCDYTSKTCIKIF